MSLTEQQKNFFESFGYLSFPGLFAAEAEAITQAFEDVWAEHGGGHYHRPHDHEQRSSLLPFIDRHPYLCALLDDERIEGIAADLLGEDFNYMSSDGNFYVGDTNWHSDGYDRSPGYRSIKIAFYLDPVGRDSGCLRFIPGSHNMGDAFSDAVQEVVPSGRFDRTEEFWGVAGNDVPAQALETEPGDMVVFIHRLKHASYGGGTRRRMFTINLQQRFREEDEEMLRASVGALARHWVESAYAPTMLETAGLGRMRHLEQRLAHCDHLPALVAKARRDASEPSRH